MIMSISANIRYHSKLYQSDLSQCRLVGNQAGAGVEGNADHRKGLQCLRRGGALDGALLNQSCLVPTYINYESYVCALARGRKCRRMFVCVGCADRVNAASELHLS